MFLFNALLNIWRVMIQRAGGMFVFKSQYPYINIFFKFSRFKKHRARLTCFHKNDLFKKILKTYREILWNRIEDMYWGLIYVKQQKQEKFLVSLERVLSGLRNQYCIVLYCHALFKRMLGFNFLWMHGWGNQICGNARIIQLYVYFVDLRVQLGPVFALLCDRGLAQAVSLSYAEFSHLVA